MVLDVEASFAELSDAQLALAARGESIELGGLPALKVLAARRSALLAAVVAPLLVDLAKPITLRRTAARALLRVPPAVAREIAVDALSRRGALVAETASVLGVIGDASTLPVLQDARAAHEGATRAAVEFAMTLIGHRSRLDEHLVAPPGAEQLLSVRAEAAEGLEFRSNSAIGSEALGQMQEQVPGLRLTTKGFAIHCGSALYHLAFVHPFDDAQALASLAERSAAPLVMFREGYSLERPFLTLYVLTRPSPDRSKVELVCVRPHGETVYAGSLVRSGHQYRLLLRSVAKAHSAAIQLSGVYDSGTGALALETALSERTLHPSAVRRQPRPAGPVRGVRARIPSGR